MNTIIMRWMMHTAGVMTRKLFILGVVLAVCLELSQGKPSLQAKTVEDYLMALTQIQGVSIYMHGVPQELF
jgi:hypothetical protein